MSQQYSNEEIEILIDNDNFTLHSEVSGPALAAVVILEFILSLASNLFVLIFTLWHPKTLKQPSIIFLTNFIIANLMVTILVMPFTIITASVGEWIFGGTLEQKDKFCQFTGFVFSYGIQLTLLTLTVISVDRFLFIVKPFLHKRIMKTWVALVIVAMVWLLACLINIPPYLGLGQYAFGQFTATCVQVWVGHRDYLAFLCIIILIVIVTITVTTLWTFCFTRNFLKRTYKSTANNSSNEAAGEGNSNPVTTDYQKHVYTSRMRKLTGMFSGLLVVNVVALIPPVLIGIAGVIVGAGNLPPQLITVVIVSFLISNVLNPLVQAYFRRDMKDFIVRICGNILRCTIKQKGMTQTTDTTSHSNDQSKHHSTQLSNLALDKV